MTEQLKTLTDLQYSTCVWDIDIESMDIVEVKDLKQEAISWIKKWEKSIGGATVIEFIKYFFNITDEDLK